MLDWSRFQSLAGADTDKFEKLCRGVIRRNFGYLGNLHELKNQPGVEFLMTLNANHQRLANKNETVGWQCKWFSYRNTGQLTNSAKRQIQHSLNKTKEHVSKINHWILWTHKLFSKLDQEWYFDLQSEYDFILHLWSPEDLDELLSGPALDLRNTYFGELALTQEMLFEQHDKSIAPVKGRWVHEVHQQMNAELKVRQILGEKEAWVISKSVALNLEKSINTIDLEVIKPEYSNWKMELETFNVSCKLLFGYCDIFNTNIYGNNIETIRDTLAKIDKKSKFEIHRILMQLRKKNLPLSLTITNALAYVRDAKKIFQSAIELLSQQFVAIIADAGGGKTQLSAELTANSPDRPAGILILGRCLKKGMRLDDIAQSFIFYQKKVNNFESLISAINSVGERSSRRLPIVIDGLNEAQDPREWKDLFESILPILKKYPNVVLVCTLRTSEKNSGQQNRRNKQRRYVGRENKAKMSLPESAFEIFSEGFDENVTKEAIIGYFKHYKINADPFSAPLNFFSHPLNLKIFCEVTNRKAENIVEVSNFPSSIYSLFREQIRHTTISIVGMTNLNHRYRNEEIDKAVYFLGECLWEDNTRSLNEDVFRTKSNFPLIDWDSDIVNLLAQEGIIFRDESDVNFVFNITPVYDRLGGYIVAEYLLKKNTIEKPTDWATDCDFIDKLFGDNQNQHPLSQDILFALIVLIPKTHNKLQLWSVLPEECKSSVLAMSYLIDIEDICLETIEKYRFLLVNDGISANDIEHLLLLRYEVEHPLNAEFLSEVLLSQSVTTRDLSWTEYLRNQSLEIIKGIKNQISNLKSGSKITQDKIRLRILFYSWLLTSTVIDLRDLATELLVLLGQQSPESLFELTIERLNINDPYISERLLAASYSVFVTFIDSPEHKEILSSFARNLYVNIFTENAINPTTHLLGREYASCTLKLFKSHHPDISNNLDERMFTHPFSKIPEIKWGHLEKNELENSRYNSPFRMDFENYTVGNLINGRRNYDYSNEEYKIAIGRILWRVSELGWTQEKFHKVENSIESRVSSYSRVSRARVERYGKKYSWIAYYELAGKLDDEGKLKQWGERRFKTDIDPFFPSNTEPTDFGSHDFLADKTTSTENWIFNKKAFGLSKILEIEKNGSKWVLLNGSISEESSKLNRHFFCAISTAFISNQNMKKIDAFTEKKKVISWPENQSCHDVYSGELYIDIENRTLGKSIISIETGYKTETIERPEIRMNDKIYSKGGSFTHRIPIRCELEVLMTAINYNWDNSGSSITSINKLALAPWIVAKSKISFDPSTFTYVDEDCEPAVLTIKQKGDSYDNYRDLLYIRKDLFENLKKSLGMTLALQLNGERRYAKTESIVGNKTYCQFESISGLA